jgi:hypothetical protein
MEAFNIEHKILNKQPKHIAYIIDTLSGAVDSLKGIVMGTEGSTTKDVGQLTSKEQQDALNKALTQAGKFTPRETAAYQSGTVLNQDDLKYNTPNAALTAGKISNVGYGGVNQEGVSIAGLDKLTSADPSARLAGVASKLEGQAGAGQGFQAEMDASIKDAYKTLAETRVAGKRGLSGAGGRYSSATEEMDSQAYEQFGASVGNAIQQAKEKAFTQRQQLTLEALKGAGDVTAKGLSLETDAATAAANIELAAYSKASDVGLSNVTNVIQGLGTIDANSISNAQNQVQAALQAGTLTVAEADNLNNLILKRDAQYNQSVQQNLSTMVAGGTAQTQENIVTQDAGSEGLLGPMASAATSVATAKVMTATCMPGTTEIDTWEGDKAIEDIEVGDKVIGYNGLEAIVLQKHQYMNPEWRKVYTVTFKDGAQIEVCDNHKIMGVPIKDLKESEFADSVESLTYRTGVSVTYDILTSSFNGGYRIQGVEVNSMIPEMVTEAIKLQEAA